MTEKRFTLEEFGLNFIVNDNGRNLTARKTVDTLNELHDENLKLQWILRHYNPQDLNLSFDDEKFKEQIELLYSEKEFLDDRKETI